MKKLVGYIAYASTYSFRETFFLYETDKMRYPSIVKPRVAGRDACLRYFALSTHGTRQKRFSTQF